jgi:hypothetical protein
MTLDDIEAMRRCTAVLYGVETGTAPIFAADAIEARLQTYIIAGLGPGDLGVPAIRAFEGLRERNPSASVLGHLERELGAPAVAALRRDTANATAHATETPNA